jgi:dihydrodipicolinate synthase/N-acetylneuraminate lyase
LKEKIAALKERLANGVSPAMATPLQADGYQVNVDVVPQLVDFLIDAGVKGLFVGGTTGEGILLETSERKRLHEATVAAADGRVPVLLQVGANRTDVAVALARHAQQIGADAIAAVTPYYYGVDDDSLFGYYAAIAQAASQTPLLLYDIPHMAINGISPDLLSRLDQEFASLAGVKTSNRDAQQVRRLLAAATEPLIILGGNETVALGLLALGTHGIISGLSTAVPEPFVALSEAMARGDMATARRQQQLINQMLAEFPAGRRIGVIKQILAERGIAVGGPVPPRAMPGGHYWSRLAALMDGAI